MEATTPNPARYCESMSLENVDLIKEMYVAFHGGDAGRALSYFDEDVVVDATVRVDGGIGHGREELLGDLFQ